MCHMGSVIASFDFGAFRALRVGTDTFAGSSWGYQRMRKSYNSYIIRYKARFCIERLLLTAQAFLRLFGSEILRASKPEGC